MVAGLVGTSFYVNVYNYEYTLADTIQKKYIKIKKLCCFIMVYYVIY